VWIGKSTLHQAYLLGKLVHLMDEFKIAESCGFPGEIHFLETSEETDFRGILLIEIHKVANILSKGKGRIVSRRQHGPIQQILQANPAIPFEIGRGSNAITGVMRNLNNSSYIFLDLLGDMFSLFMIYMATIVVIILVRLAISRL
jgi:hypothetical protein